MFRFVIEISLIAIFYVNAVIAMNGDGIIPVIIKGLMK